MELEKSKLQRARRTATGAKKGRGTKAGTAREQCGGGKKIETAAGDVGEDESVEVERRVKALRRLVPGGEGMEIDVLFEETAEYIEELRGQVMVMRSLTDFVDAVAREKRLMGR